MADSNEIAKGIFNEIEINKCTVIVPPPTTYTSASWGESDGSGYGNITGGTCETDQGTIDFAKVLAHGCGPKSVWKGQDDSGSPITCGKGAYHGKCTTSVVGHLEAGGFDWRGRCGYGGNIVGRYHNKYGSGIQDCATNNGYKIVYYRTTRYTAESAMTFSKKYIKLLDIAATEPGLSAGSPGHGAIFLGIHKNRPTSGKECDCGWTSDAQQGWEPRGCRTCKQAVGIDFLRLIKCETLSTPSTPPNSQNPTSTSTDSSGGGNNSSTSNGGSGGNTTTSKKDKKEENLIKFIYKREYEGTLASYGKFFIDGIEFCNAIDSGTREQGVSNSTLAAHVMKGKTYHVYFCSDNNLQNDVDKIFLNKFSNSKTNGKYFSLQLRDTKGNNKIDVLRGYQQSTSTNIRIYPGKGSVDTKGHIILSKQTLVPRGMDYYFGTIPNGNNDNHYLQDYYNCYGKLFEMCKQKAGGKDNAWVGILTIE